MSARELAILLLLFCVFLPNVKAGTQLYSWGQDMWGQLGVRSGIGGANNNIQPTPTSLVTSEFPQTYSSVKFVEGLSYYSSLILVKDSNMNVIKIMGNGYQNYLPNFSTNNNFYSVQLSPTPMTDFGKVSFVYNGKSCTILGSRDSQNNLNLYSWGDSKYGCLGDGNTNSSRGVLNSPVSVVIPDKCKGDYLKQVSIFDHVLMLCQDTTAQYIYGFGLNANNELGSSLSSSVYTPTLLDMSPLSGKIITKVVASSKYSVVLTSDSSLYLMGTLSNCFINPTFTKITGLPIDTNQESIVDIAVTYYHVLLLTNTSKIILYGNKIMDLGKYITATSCGSSVLTSLVNLGSKPSKVFASNEVIMVISNNNQVYTLGNNQNGNLGIGNTSTVDGSFLVNITVPSGNLISDATLNSNANYIGISDTMYCNGVSYTSNSVCSGHGTCVTQTCICSPGYYGNNCDEFTCFGILKNSASVCSGNGKCTSLDTCQCTNGATSRNCTGGSTPKTSSSSSKQSAATSMNGNQFMVLLCSAVLMWIATLIY